MGVAAQAKAILKEDKQTIFGRVRGSLVYLESGGYNNLLSHVFMLVRAVDVQKSYT